MSHQATRWAVGQRGLKPATKIVLIALADRHNPKHGCFPSHAQLAEDCEMSERSVRDHLRLLEDRGLIRKLPRGRRNGEFTSSGYELEIEHKPNTQRQDLPTVEAADADLPAADSRIHQRQNLPPNPVKGTTQEGARAGVSDDFDFRDRLVLALGYPDPAAAGPWWEPANLNRHRGAWLALGLTEAEIVEAARESRKNHPRPPDGPKALDGFLERWARKRRGLVGRKLSRRSPCTSESPAPLEAQLEQLASWIKGGRFVPPSAATPSKLRELVARGLVTQSDLRARGLAA